MAFRPGQPIATSQVTRGPSPLTEEGRVQLRFASYNIHKSVGLDRRRDPERILAVLHELGADVVALQESDRRFGRRIACLPRRMLAEHHWQVAPVARRPDSIGWHGNALLVRRGIDIRAAQPLDLPTLEPRGAVRADLALEGHHFSAIGMHLDLSGLRRRHQLEAIFAQCRTGEGAGPIMAMGDLNEWLLSGGSLRAVPQDWAVETPGRTFPSRQPVAQLDRFLVSPGWSLQRCWVHHSPLAAQASDHLPALIEAQLVPNK